MKEVDVAVLENLDVDPACECEQLVGSSDDLMRADEETSTLTLQYEDMIQCTTHQTAADGQGNKLPLRRLRHDRIYYFLYLDENQGK